MMEYDRVELIVDKKCYTNEGVHKGMTGWICDSRKINQSWLVCFDEDEQFASYPILAVKEDDLKVVEE